MATGQRPFPLSVRSVSLSRAVIELSPPVAVCLPPAETPVRRYQGGLVVSLSNLGADGPARVPWAPSTSGRRISRRQRRLVFAEHCQLHIAGHAEAGLAIDDDGSLSEV